MSRHRSIRRLWPAHPLLSLALGAYAGLLVVLWFVATAGRSPTAESTLAPAWLAVAIVAVLSAPIPNLGSRLSRTRLHYALVAVPIVVTLAHFWAGYVTVGPDFPLTESTFLIGLLSAVPAAAVIRLAENARADGFRDCADALVTWTARTPRSAVRRKHEVYAFGGVLIVAGIAVDVVSADVVPILAGTAIGSALGYRYRSRSRLREFVAYPDGLVVDPQSHVETTVVPWSRLSGYSLTDDALVLHRRPRWPIYCTRDDIADLDGVLRCLDRNLDRLDNGA